MQALDCDSYTFCVKKEQILDDSPAISSSADDTTSLCDSSTYCVKEERILDDCQTTSSLANECTTLCHEVKVDEIDIHLLLKQAAKGAEDDNFARWVASEPSQSTSNIGKELQWRTRGNYSTPRIPSKVNKKFKTRSDSNDFQHLTLIRCPACDKTFKGGKRRVTSLLEHVNKSHYKQRKRLTSIITA